MGVIQAGQGAQGDAQDMQSASSVDLLPGEGLGLVTLQDLAEDSVEEQPLVRVRKPKKEPRRKAKSKVMPDPKWKNVTSEQMARSDKLVRAFRSTKTSTDGTTDGKDSSGEED